MFAGNTNGRTTQDTMSKSKYDRLALLASHDVSGVLFDLDPGAW